MPSTLRVMQADITTLQVDAIVNAAQMSNDGPSSLHDQLQCVAFVGLCVRMMPPNDWLP